MLALGHEGARPFQNPAQLAVGLDGQGDLFKQGLHADGFDDAIVHAAFVQKNKTLFVGLAGDADDPQLRIGIFELPEQIGHVPASEVLLNEQQGRVSGRDHVAQGVQQHIGVAADGQAAGGHLQPRAYGLAQQIGKCLVVGNTDDLAVVAQIFDNSFPIELILNLAFGHGFRHGLLDLPELYARPLFAVSFSIRPPSR